MKFLLTILIIYVVWFAFKHRTRIVAAHRAVMEQKAREEAMQRRSRAREVVAQDLVPCPQCGAYIPAGTACTCEKSK